MRVAMRMALVLGVGAITMAAPVAAEARRVALVIGNGAYENLSPLANPVRDAERMGELLRDAGFEVMDCGGERPGCHDLDRNAMTDAIEDFSDMAEGAELALFFFAGHGMQTAEGNLIAPVNVEIGCDMLRARRATMLDDVLSAMDGAAEKVVILDACRNDPFGAQQCATRGARPLSFGAFAVPDGAQRFLLMSSTRNGQLAQDGAPGGHSPFAESLFHWMEREPAVNFDQMLDRVAKRVIERTAAANFTQVPELLIRGGAPETCLAGSSCAADPRAAALRMEVEALRAERARNQEYEEIVVTLLRNAGHGDLASLSDAERSRFFAGLMAASQALAERGGEGEVALAALRRGDDGPAEALFLRDVADDDRDLDDRRRAAAARHLAALARPGDTLAALEHYRLAVELDPGDAQTWIDLAEASLAAGLGSDASNAYARAYALTERGLATPEQRVWIAEGRADMEWASGQTDAALALYREANLAAREAAAAEPNLSGPRRGILVTHYNIGHLAMDAGDIAAALDEFRAGLTVAETLAAEEPFDPRWRFDIGRGHERIGRALQRAGDLDGALIEYRQKHAIMEKVAAAFPGNPVWTRDLSLAEEFLADIAVAKGDHAEAARRYGASLGRMIPLREADPGNADHQRFTSVTHLALGDALTALGDLAGAVENYRAAVEVSERLTRQDPKHAQWRWDLFRAYQRMASSRPPGAEWHAKALDTIEALEADGKLVENNRRWIAITRERLEAARVEAR